MFLRNGGGCLRRDRAHLGTQHAVRVSLTPFILRHIVLICARDSDKDGWEMSTEDVDSWDATLQVCLARVFDDGGDATRVLDHLAGTIEMVPARISQPMRQRRAQQSSCSATLTSRPMRLRFSGS